MSDVGSSNGTYLEDRRLTANVEHEIKHNQRIVIGRFVIRAALQTSQTERAESKVKGPVDNEEFTLRAKIHVQLIDRLDLRRKDILKLTDFELRAKTAEMVERILDEMRWEIPAGLDRALLIKHVLDEALGLGPLEELLADEKVSEIMVNSYDRIFAERGGRLALTPLRFSSEATVLSAIERIISPIGRRIDESSPLVDARLKDGSRVNAVIRPLALKGPCITIRKFAKTPLTIDHLVNFGSMSRGMADFLSLVVTQRLNVVISGGTGSGKTTLLNVLARFIPEGERVITVEDAAELQLGREHIVSFETRPPNLEGKGAIAIRDLVRNALRMRPDRIVVGECRGAEALDMLQAMNTGHDGSMTTGHANSPVDMISRLETMVLMAGMDLPVRAIREQISSAVHVIVQQSRLGCGSRKVTAIAEIVGLDPDDGRIQLQDIFVFRQDGFDDQGKTRGKHQATGYVPKFFRRMQQEGKQLDGSIFAPDA
ncbi:Flp pilus assembly complex ATPase component TadA [bacterium]|nr:Flp pilus assembly complex ATPase component TadA [bacterium]